MDVTYVQDRNIGAYQLLLVELGDELGDRFRESIKNWCGIGMRPYPLPTWQLFLAKNEEYRVLGLCSYYQQLEDPVKRFWIGWIAVRKGVRRRHIASRMLDFICDEVIKRGARELWVYTDSAPAERLYRSFGMIPVGRFAEFQLKQAAASGREIVLRKSI
jgi:ribosomal protein S18 acetylase RimI-like enzyme